jgi:hypothetical protein
MPKSGATYNDSAEDARGLTPGETQEQRRPDAARKTPRREIGGPQGPEPTRYGDWERNGRCTDF